MARCRTLREYSEFVARIRKYADEETAIEKAVDRAVTECIAEGLLANFLRSQRAEVVAVSIFSDSALLENWLKAAVEADTIEAFMEKTGLKRN